jgi:type II secretion system protein N
MALTVDQQRWARRLGYPALALFTFVMGVHCGFPYDRVKDRVVGAMSGSYDVEIAELGPGWWPGRYYLEGLTLTTKPKEGEKPRTIRVDRVDVNVGLLALLTKTMSVDLDAELGEGRVTGRVEVAKNGAIALNLQTTDLPIESVPGLDSVTGGAPMKGGFEVHVDLRLPTKKASDAEGTITVACEACVLGDGVTKVKLGSGSNPNSAAFNQEGFTLPRIKIGKIDGKIVIGRGAICIDHFHSKSVHGEMELAGGILFAEPFKSSQTQLYARVKLSEAFKEESGRNRDFDILTFAAARQPDGYSAYSARTTVGTFKWLIAKRPIEPLKQCQGIGDPIKGPEPKPSAKPSETTVVAPSPPPPTPTPQPTPVAPAKDDAPVVPPPPPVEPPAPTPAPSDQPTNPPPQKDVEPVPVPVPPPPEATPPPATEPPVQAQPLPDQTQPQQH